MAIAGLRGSDDFHADDKPKDFREAILMRNPSGSAPIFALMARAGKRVVTAPEFNWWGEVNDLIRLQVNGAHASTDMLINVDSGDPSAASPTNQYGEATNLKEGDILMVEPSADAATFDHELIEVTQVVSATQFTARRGVGGTTAGSIANDRYLFLLGSAYAEGTGVPRATFRNPFEGGNYTQIFKDTYELTGTADASVPQMSGQVWSTDKRRKMFKHSVDLEMSILWGRKHKTTGENGKPKRFMGGLRSFIPASRTTVFTPPVTWATLTAAMTGVFDYDTGAGNQRIIMAGNGALAELQKIIAADTGIRRDLTPNMKAYGMAFTQILTPFGDFFVKTHPLLNRHPIYTYSMWVLDFSAIKWCPLKGRDTKTYDDVQTRDEDVRRGYVQTEGSIEVQQNGLTMAYLGNVKAA